ncbi:XRE family transcriptional regulator [Pseudoflavonifractor sp. 60]|uniref:helix-turn-helix domain-containing protein n=1 Tax=Pseudoflavonifractor sp. 60 TaxID=2304576 RepID=UPI00136DAEB9|nr:helix-turn-helix transcriptional regulator [Pseudoflavonifractor sp. 60]NBI67552.1 XRE family transcriptional regulator [Pseudoflavonifractor sp. 60]
MFSKKEFGQRIMGLRKEHHETQAVLADLLGVGKNQISEIERGNRTTSAERIALICQHYGVSSDYLLGLTDDPEPNYKKDS